MKDIHVLHWYPNFLGGGAVSASVCELAAGQRALGARVTVAAIENSATPLYEAVRAGEGVEILTWRPGRALSFAGKRLHFLPRAFAQKLRALQPDIVHIHGEINPDNLWLPRLFRCPILLGPRGAFHPNAINNGDWLSKRVYLPLARHLLYRHVALFDALTPAEVEHIRALMPGAPVACIPHGANPRIRDVMHLEPAASRADPEEIRLTCVARLDIFTKGLDTLIDAFAKLVSAVPQKRVSLTIIGPDQGGAQASLLAQARALGIQDRLRFAGKMSFAEVWQELKSSDLFVLLSRREGLGTVMVEALLAGKPVVVSTEVGASCYPELLAMPHVLRVPPEADAAARAMVQAIGRLPELSCSAHFDRERIAALFSWENAAKQLLGCYAELLRPRDVAIAPVRLGDGAARLGT